MYNNSCKELSGQKKNNLGLVLIHKFINIVIDSE